MTYRSRRLICRAEHGQVIALLVVVTVGLIAIAGLVDDGGRALAARARALDEAQAAARTGAQQINLTLLRQNGSLALEAAAATRAAEDYLSTTGDRGTAAISGDTVHVTVTVSVATQILGAFGVRTLTLSADADASAIPGSSRSAP
jgi:hypothetical protein